MKNNLLLLLFTLVSPAIWAIDDYEITVLISNYEQDKLLLAHNVGSTIFVDDTVSVNQNGTFTFEAKKDLAAGIYLLVMPPENEFIEVFLTETDRQFSVAFDATTLAENAVFENAPDNSLFYEYLEFMRITRPKMEKLIQTIQEGRAANVNVDAEEKALKTLEQELAGFKKNIIDKHPEKLTTTILKSSQQIDIPAFEGDEMEVRLLEYVYRKNHYFDPIRHDKRFFRSKICYDMITFYMDNLTVPQPDSVIQSVYEVLQLVAPDTVAFKSYFYQYLNKYYGSDLMGMDAVFVHMVKEYTLKGKTDFISEESRAKITQEALLWDKTLIGRTAPNLEHYLLDIEKSIPLKDAEDENRRFALAGQTDLNSVSKPYTVVVFWAPDCSHCKESMPHIVDFYEHHQTEVEVFAVCHTDFRQFGDCAQKLQDYNATKWINTVDPYYKYIKDYHIETTPLILVLDANKKVVYKRIGAEQLELALEQMKKRSK